MTLITVFIRNGHVTDTRAAVVAGAGSPVPLEQAASAPLPAGGLLPALERRPSTGPA